MYLRKQLSVDSPILFNAHPQLPLLDSYLKSSSTVWLHLPLLFLSLTPLIHPTFSMITHNVHILPSLSCVCPTTIWSLGQLWSFTHLCCSYPWRCPKNESLVHRCPFSTFFTLAWAIIANIHLSLPFVATALPGYININLFLGHNCSFSTFSILFGYCFTGIH